MPGHLSPIQNKWKFLLALLQLHPYFGLSLGKGMCKHFARLRSKEENNYSRYHGGCNVRIPKVLFLFFMLEYSYFGKNKVSCPLSKSFLQLLYRRGNISKFPLTKMVLGALVSCLRTLDYVAPHLRSHLQF